MKVINFFGEPCAGKTTASFGLSYLMKKKGYNVEYVPEFAKELVYEDSINKLLLQNLIFAKQESRLSILKDKVDYCIVDSPLLNSYIYAPENYYPSFQNYCLEVFNHFNNVNLFIKRNHIYKTDGRVQNENEAKEIGEKIIKMLEKYTDNYYIHEAGDDTPDKILNFLETEKLI